MAQAYVAYDEVEAGILRAQTYAADVLGLAGTSNPDVVVLRYGLFSVEDARMLADVAARAPLVGAQKAVIIAATRVFHEAQNALLKLCEEPPEGTTLILVLPTEGVLLPTLRSRLLPLPHAEETSIAEMAEAARAFVTGTAAAREKQVAKLLDRAKADKDVEKRAARAEAVQLVEGCIRAAAALEASAPAGKRRTLFAFQEDLHTFLPILHERSAPLKPIFEHLLLTMPEGLSKAPV